MVAVRESTKEDIDTIYDLILAIAQHHDQVENVRTSKPELEKSGYCDNPKFGVLLAETDGSVIGYASYTWNYSIWAGSDYMNIDDVFVRKEFRGKKVGEALMSKAREVCKLHGFNRLRWEVQKGNAKALSFYKRLGATADHKDVCHWQAE